MAKLEIAVLGIGGMGRGIAGSAASMPGMG